MEGKDEENYVVLRAERNFVLLNRYPYSTGHVLIAPYEHAATLEETDSGTLEELMRLGQRVEIALRDQLIQGRVVARSPGAGLVMTSITGRPFPHRGRWEPSRARPRPRRRRTSRGAR